MIMKRENCVLCESELKEFYKINSMPVFMGVLESNINVIRENMIFSECTFCGLIQIQNLIDTSLVYFNNHNTEVVGKTWQNHYLEFSKFIKNNSEGDFILEIGDPSGKLASPLKEFYKKWIIIEPNTELKNYDNVEIIKEFFDGKNPTNYKFSTIVHSHVFEHIYDPIKFLKDCNNILEYGGVTIFSIPNIKWLLENKSLPTSILHFEHTFYINKDNVKLFLNKCGFELEEIYEFSSHSLFIRARKSNNLSEVLLTKVNDKIKFMELVYFYNNKIKDINDNISNSEYYLYSAHINSQFLLKNGISKNIKGLLDKSKAKIGKKLYGYEYDILSIESIANDLNPIVVASHMGVYYEEIKNNLLEINKNVIVL